MKKKKIIKGYISKFNWDTTTGFSLLSYIYSDRHLWDKHNIKLKITVEIISEEK